MNRIGDRPIWNPNPHRRTAEAGDEPRGSRLGLGFDAVSLAATVIIAIVLGGDSRADSSVVLVGVVAVVSAAVPVLTVGFRSGWARRSLVVGLTHLLWAFLLAPIGGLAFLGTSAFFLFASLGHYASTESGASRLGLHRGRIQFGLGVPLLVLGGWLSLSLSPLALVGLGCVVGAIVLLSDGLMRAMGAKGRAASGAPTGRRLGRAILAVLVAVVMAYVVVYVVFSIVVGPRPEPVAPESDPTLEPLVVPDIRPIS